MTDELKPCPFCGGKAKSWVTVDDFWCSGRAGCVNEDCGVNPVARGTNEKSAVKIWNARAAVIDGEAWQRVRTCRKVPGKMHYGERRPKCSECGYGLGDSRWAYCPSCGAKVVE